MKILVLGGDGYIGWPLCQFLATKGHIVHTIDNGIRRRRVAENGGDSLVPICSFQDRIRAARKANLEITYEVGDVAEPGVLESAFRSFMADAVVHLAQQPSAPFSMLSVEHAVSTQSDNISSTVRLLFALRDLAPDCHLVKLGTMGQYGTPDMLPLEEGYLEVVIDGNSATIPMPKLPGSFYHASKAHDSINIEMAARLWNLRATELNQGVVYGHHPGFLSDGSGATRFDYDAVNGTVVNRFVVQAAVGLPLSVYGSGEQTRGLIALSDALECIRLVVENPPGKGRLRVFNQMTEYRSIRALAELISSSARSLDIDVTTEYRTNPRVEADRHHYAPIFRGLQHLGLDPKFLSEGEIRNLIQLALVHSNRISVDTIQPKHSWTVSLGPQQ